jgi:tRNA dimethylallyltransferase
MKTEAHVCGVKGYELITVVGPTASGKTAFAAALARSLGSDVISGDSRQVYRRMDIGTGKDLSDYVVDGVAVPYHLIDVCEPGTKYNVFQYQRDFFEVFFRLRGEGKTPVLCGGTGMYIEAALKGYKLLDVPPDPALRNKLYSKSLPELEAILASYKTLHNKTDVDSVQRAVRAIEIEEYYRRQSPDRRDYEPLNSLVVGVAIDREARRERISARLRQRLAQGMVEEVQALLNEGIAAESLLYYGLEYKFITQYLTGVIGYNDMVRQLETAIHQFAKRQMTWFRGMERRGIRIHWLDANLTTEEKVQRVLCL